MTTAVTRSPRAAAPVPESHPPRWRLVLVLAGLTLLIGVVAALTYRHLAEGGRRAMHRTLAVIAEQKRMQLEDRLAQSRIDAELYFSGHAQVARLFSEWLAGGRQDQDLLAQMRSRVAEVAQARGWGGVVLRDTEGRVVLAVGGGEAAPAQPREEVLRRPEVRFVDLHRSAPGHIEGDTGGDIEYGVLAPVALPDSAPLGTVYLSWRAAGTLYPLVESWPVPTRSAETYLVRRDGAAVDYLSPLRYGDAPPLVLTRPLDAPDLSAALAARGERGILGDARDYRGVPVLAYATAIAGTPWLMLAEIDRQEAYADSRGTAWATALVVGLGLLLVYTAGFLRWRRDRLQRELAALRVQREVEARFRAVFEQSPLGMVLLDADGHVAEVNRRFSEILGRTAVDGEDLDWLTGDPGGGPAGGVDAGPAVRLERRWERPDGTLVWIGVSRVPVTLGQGEAPRRLALIEDISARKEAEERLHCITDAAHDAILMLDPRGAVSYWNPAATAILGYSTEEVLGRNLHALLAPERYLEEYRAAFPHFQHAGQGAALGKTIELAARRKDGTELAVALSLSAVALKDGWHAVGILRDISERRQMEQALSASEERYRLALEATSEGLWDVAVATGAVVVNDRWFTMLGYAPGEVAPTFALWKSHLHPDDAPAIYRAHEEYLSGRRPSYEIEHRVITRNGEVRWHRSVGKLVASAPDGTPLRLVGTNADITAQRALEQGLEAARQAAEAANAAKSAFLAHISHEIRTPLNAVLGLTQLLEKTALAADQWDMVHLIHNAGRSLLGILNDVLDLSKIEAGQMHFEQRPFDLAPVLAQLESLLGTTARAKGLGMRIELPGGLDSALVGDPLRLEQVLANLIGNAIKFTEHGEVRVRIAARQSDAAAVRLRFEVTDTGIGIEPEVLDGLFRPFVQADGSITRRFGGTGLGLSICKHLVELQSGTIGAESRPGEGSTFWVELPFGRVAAALAPAAPAAAPRAAGPRLAGLHFLVVDDSAVNRDLIRQMLGMEGARVTLAEDGRQALELLCGRPPGFDAVLMDVQMPVLDGLSATRAIRADPDLAALPVIALTAGVLDDQQAAARAAGVNEVLAKPLDLERMVVMLSAWVEPRPGAAGALGQPDGSPLADAAGVGEFPLIAGIDRARVAQTLGNNRAMFLRLLAGFIAESAEVAEQARRDLDAGERTRALRRLHTLRGNAGSLGALELMAAAGRLEDALSAGATNLAGGLAALGRQIAALIEASAPWCGAAAAAPAATPPLSPQALEELRAALRAQSMTALRRFEALEAGLGARLGESEAAALGRAIRGLRFGEALARLDQACDRDRCAA